MTTLKAKKGDISATSGAHTKLSRGDKTFYGINGVILVLLFLMVLLPILTVFANAFSSGEAVATGRVSFWPQTKNSDGVYGLGVSVEGFVAAFKNDRIVTGYGNTILYTLAGTVFNMFLTLLAAYPLSRDDLPGRNKIMALFAFTMIFNGGMIPNYLLLKDLKMLNTRWAIIIPMAINVYNMVICRTFFKTTIPKELLEAAQLDGCSDFKFLISIVMPLSKAILAVIGLYYGVFHWNAYFNAFLYLTDKALYPLQIVLKEILLSSVVSAEMLEGANTGTVDFNLIHVLRYALIVVACLPIWMVYPFLQKYFVQGVMIGSIKG